MGIRQRISTVVGCAMVMALLPAAGASAATITVNTTNDDFNSGATCSLREAVQAANTNAAFSGCNADTAGPDTIVLQAGQTYSVKGTFNAEDSNIFGDLDITGQTTIMANGGLATIDAVGAAASSGNKDRAIQVLSTAGVVTLQNLRIQNGRVASGASAVGGGGILSDAPLTIIDSEIVNNRVDVNGVNTQGGGIQVRGPLGSLTMTGSTVAGNVLHVVGAPGSGTTVVGGGISVYFGAPFVNITNSTISGNTALGENTVGPGVVGAAFFGDYSSPENQIPTTLIHNTITGNVATLGGALVGGIQINNGTMTGNVIAGNTDDFTHAPDCKFGPTSTGGANVIGNRGTSDGCVVTGTDDLVGTVATPVNANLGTLVDNGGLTRTHLPNPGSPAINRGGTCPATDQRGLFRYISAPCDSGSVEVGATSVPPPSSTPPGPTGQRAAALAKCNKKKKKKARKKCRRNALLLPV